MNIHNRTLLKTVWKAGIISIYSSASILLIIAVLLSVFQTPVQAKAGLQNGNPTGASLQFKNACQGDCSQVKAQLCNAGSGAMDAPGEWAVYRGGKPGSPQNGVLVYSGTFPALSANQCAWLTYDPQGTSGKYIFWAGQPESHPGTGNTWSEACEISCSGDCPTATKTPTRTSTVQHEDPTATRTSTPTLTDPTSTPTATRTNVPTNTPTPTETDDPTSTPTPTATEAPTSTATETHPTSTPTSTATLEVEDPDTATPTRTPTEKATHTATATQPSVTSTPVNTHTATPTPVVERPTATRTKTHAVQPPTATPTHTDPPVGNTATPTRTATHSVPRTEITSTPTRTVIVVATLPPPSNTQTQATQALIPVTGGDAADDGVQVAQISGMWFNLGFGLLGLGLLLHGLYLRLMK